MRYGIFSDVHSNLEALDAVIAAYKKESIDQYLCVGDVVGYGADPRECIDKVKAIALFTVAGNHDWAATGLFPAEYFNQAASEAIAWTKRNLNTQCWGFLESLQVIFKNRDLTLVHGTLHEPEDFHYMTDTLAARHSFGLMEGNICFVGHSHMPGVFIRDLSGRISYKEKQSLMVEKGNLYIVNVGSVGQPRDLNPDAAYCVYDTEENNIEIKRVKYDTGSARKKIIDAGLPGFLGDRLLSGR
ncbi:MAG: metallophosphoesterase family protein [Deltaproteobacteria bacterium]